MNNFPAELFSTKVMNVGYVGCQFLVSNSILLSLSDPLAKVISIELKMSALLENVHEYLFSSKITILHSVMNNLLTHAH